MPSINKRLRIVAGPNGSGKSTLIGLVKNNFFCGPFVNADLIERSFFEKGLLNLADFNLDLYEKVV
jgi:predicted ABC-type ATPase